MAYYVEETKLSHRSKETYDDYVVHTHLMETYFKFVSRCADGFVFFCEKSPADPSKPRQLYCTPVLADGFGLL